jgi:ankyrin repeat protein
VRQEIQDRLLIVSVLQGDIEGATSALDRGDDVNVLHLDESDALGSCPDRTSLHIAAINQNKEMCELLINRDANLEAQDVDERTPILLSALNDTDNVFLLLVESGANYLVIDFEGFTCLHLAVANQSINSFTAILEVFRNRSDFDVNNQNEDGESALHIAARNGKEGICLLLMKSGAKNILNKEGEKPSDLVDGENNPELKNLLKNNPNLLAICTPRSFQRLAPNAPVKKLPTDLLRLVGKMILGPEKGR